MKKRMKIKLRTVAAVLVLCLLCGCEGEGTKRSGEGELASYGSVITVKDIKEKYRYKEDGIMPLYNVSPDEKFDFVFSSDLSELGALEQAVTVHTDESCSDESEISTYYDIETTGNGTKVTVSPVAGVLATESEQKEYVESDKSVWGNAPMYYIAVWYDMESRSAEKRKTPTVIPFTVKHEVPAPEVRGVIDAAGRFKLSWSAVEGAKEYRVYKLVASDQYTSDENKPQNGAKTGYQECSLICETSTDQTEFNDFAGNGGGLAVHKDASSGKEYVIGQNYSVEGEFYVSAVVGNQESGFSGAVTTSGLKLPHGFTEKSDLMSQQFQRVSELPLVVDVENTDGSVTKRKVLYTFCKDRTYLGTEVPGYEYEVEGTALTGKITMEDTDGEYPKTVGDETPSGNVEPENDVSKSPASDLPTILTPENETGSEGTLIERQRENTHKHVNQGNEERVDNPGEYVTLFADRAEEEWLALNLVNGETEISVEAFPELQSAEKLEDVFYKVYYQNPYVLGLNRFSYDYATMTLHVSYFYDKKEIQFKQKEMKEAGEKIIADVINDAMDPEEKERAIYQYLTDNAEYDTAALEDARMNNFKKTENNEYEDSFNGYGILVNHRGVCQSYAYAYKILCEMSGVSCRVITGNLDGSLPHAWNAVKLGDVWVWTDATNNEKTSGIPYFLYNADSKTAELTGFDRDNHFELDDLADQYQSEETQYEYYQANELVADTMDRYEGILDRVLEQPGSIISIRYTGDSVDQEELVGAVQKVYNKHGMEDKLAALKCGIQSRYIVLQ